MYPSAQSSDEHLPRQSSVEQPSPIPSLSTSHHLPQPSYSSTAPSSHHANWQPWSAAPNPFAQAAGTAFADAASEGGSPGSCQSPPPDPPQQLISPFAASPQMSHPSFSSHQSGARRLGRAGSPSSSASMNGTASNVSSHPPRETNDSMENARSEESGEDGPGPFDSQLPLEEIQFDNSFVFKRKPVSMAHTRRYSTSTFFQGVCYTPGQHFSHFSTMDNLPEEGTGSSPSHTKELLVDDHTYNTTSSHFGRRALSTPEYHLSPESLPASLVHQMRTRSLSAEELLTVTPNLDSNSADSALLGTQSEPNVILTRTSPVVLKPGAGQHCTSGTNSRPHRLSVQSAANQASAAGDEPSSAQHGGQARAQHDAEVGPSQDLFGANKHRFKPHRGPPPLGVEPAFASSKSLKSEKAERSMSEDLGQVKKRPKDASHQSLIWLTFSDTDTEARYAAWFHQKIFKV